MDGKRNEETDVLMELCNAKVEACRWSVQNSSGMNPYFLLLLRVFRPVPLTDPLNDPSLTETGGSSSFLPELRLATGVTGAGKAAVVVA